MAEKIFIMVEKIISVAAKDSFSCCKRWFPLLQKMVSVAVKARSHRCKNDFHCSTIGTNKPHRTLLVH